MGETEPVSEGVGMLEPVGEGVAESVSVTDGVVLIEGEEQRKDACCTTHSWNPPLDTGSAPLLSHTGSAVIHAAEGSAVPW